MPEFVQTNEPVIRIGFFVSVFLLMTLWESAAAWRNPSSLGIRWPNNLGIVLIDVLLVCLVFPISAVGFAQFFGDNGLGLFNAIDVPWWFSIIASIVILDLAIYLQHVLFHAVPHAPRSMAPQNVDPTADRSSRRLSAQSAVKAIT